MKSSLRIYLTVFVTLLAVLNTQQVGNLSYKMVKGTVAQKPEEYKKVYWKRDKIKNGSFQDVSLVQRVPFSFEVNNVLGNSKIFTNNQAQRSFIIDARQSSDQLLIKQEKINIIIRLNDKSQFGNIEDVVKGLKIEQNEWNSESRQFKSTVFKIDQLTMQRHNQFYSILLPTLKKGMYKTTFTNIARVSRPIKIQIVYYQVYSSDGIGKAMIIPVDMSTQKTIILPENSIIQIPVSSPKQNLILSVQSCSFQSPQIYFSQNDTNTKNMLKLKNHNQQQTIFLLKNHQSPYQQQIYIKSIHVPQLFFNIKLRQNIQEDQTNSKILFNQFMLKVHKNPKHLLKKSLKFSHLSLSSIQYQIKGNNLKITYDKIYPDIKSLLQYEKQKLIKTKITYKLFASNSQQALAKRTLCDLRSYQNGKQIMVFEKIIQEQSFNDVLQKFKQKKAVNKKIQEVGEVLISLWEVKKKLQKVDPQLFIDIKVDINTETNLISSGSDNQLQQNSVKNQETFIYQPIKVDISSGAWLFFQDIKFWRLMWGFIIFGLLVLFALFFIQSLYKSWKKRMLKQVIEDGMGSPRIVITKPKMVDIEDKSLADSYGFYPSPPSSSSNIMQAYGFGGSDQIIEDQQSKQKSPKRGSVIYEPLSPTYF